MLSRSAFFLEGFSMVGDAFECGPWAAAAFPLGGALTAALRAGAGGTFLGADFGVDFLELDLFFAMGSFG
jgi:hypothetical protein